MVKGHLTGCGLHMDTVVFAFFLTSQSNMTVWFKEIFLFLFQVVLIFPVFNSSAVKNQQE